MGQSKQQVIKKSIQELELELKQAKEDEIQSRVDVELKRLSSSIGICSATHTFNRRYKSVHAYIQKITGVKHVGGDYDPYQYIIEYIEYHKQNENNCAFKVSNGSRGTLHWHPYKYDITESQFNTVKKNMLISIENLGDEFRGLLSQKEYMTNGEYTDGKQSTALLEESGYMLADVSLDKRFIELLTWEHHPLLIGQYLIISDESKHMLDLIIKKKKDNAHSWGGATYHNDMKVVTELINFKKKYFVK